MILLELFEYLFTPIFIMFHEYKIVLILILSATITIFLLHVVSKKIHFAGFIPKYIFSIAFIFTIFYLIDKVFYLFINHNVKDFQILKSKTEKIVLNNFETNNLDIHNLYDWKLYDSHKMFNSENNISISNQKKLKYDNCLKSLETKKYNDDKIYLQGEDKSLGIICEVNSSLYLVPNFIPEDDVPRTFSFILSVSKKQSYKE